MKTLLITKGINQKSIGGRELLSKSTARSLSSILSDNLEIFELFKFQKSNLKKILDIPTGHIDGVSHIKIKEILKLISEKDFKIIFLDGSNFGSIAKTIRKNFPELKIIIFFHNVEYRFFLGAFFSKPTLHSLGVLIVNYFAEKFSVNNSDVRICLSKRDSDFLFKTYKRNATHIFPLTMTDNFKENLVIDSQNDEKFILFVGGNFYANMDGIKWFLENVAPFLSIKIKILGRGLKMLKSFDGKNNIEIIGEVDDLSKWYMSCMCVVAPIFNGSGMKTKVAEALMYGRKVIGTEESFAGYEKFQDKLGWICKSADDFIGAIKAAQDQISDPFHEELREIFLKEFSEQSADLRLKKILQ
jgi:hypothetical protein